jgi:pentatricopeptide repeat protein
MKNETVAVSRERATRVTMNTFLSRGLFSTQAGVQRIGGHPLQAAAALNVAYALRAVSQSSAGKLSSSSLERHGTNNASLVLAIAAVKAREQRRSVSASVTSGSQASHSRVVVNMPADSPDDAVIDFKETFKTSVQERTVGNNALRRFVRSCDDKTWQRAVDAIDGSREGGLRIDHETYDTVLSLLLRCGQLKQALALYNTMLEEKVCPHTKTFNQLIDLCTQKQLPDSAERIFNEMIRRGRQPDVESYESLMCAYASEIPPKWEKAVAIFDKLQRNSRGTMSANTYNALMKVYSNMTPFDWRVVYNAYYEMRYHKPKIMFGWNSYQIVDAAMKKGNAGKWRRLVTFVDAWIQLTVLWSLDFWFGILVAFVCVLTVRMILSQAAHAMGAKVLDKQKASRSDVGMM